MLRRLNFNRRNDKILPFRERKIFHKKFWSRLKVDAHLPEPKALNVTNFITLFIWTLPRIETSESRRTTEILAESGWRHQIRYSGELLLSNQTLLCKNSAYWVIITIIIIIISPLQSSTGHKPLQMLAIALDLRLLASCSCQPSCANRHSVLRAFHGCRKRRRKD
jgi:hypothetical protein